MSGSTTGCRSSVFSSEASRQDRVAAQLWLLFCSRCAGKGINRLTINYVGQRVAALWEELSLPVSRSNRWIWLWLDWRCSSPARSERRLLLQCGGRGRGGPEFSLSLSHSLLRLICSRLHTSRCNVTCAAEDYWWSIFSPQLKQRHECLFPFPYFHVLGMRTNYCVTGLSVHFSATTDNRVLVKLLTLSIVLWDRSIFVQCCSVCLLCWPLHLV